MALQEFAKILDPVGSAMIIGHQFHAIATDLIICAWIFKAMINDVKDIVIVNRYEVFSGDQSDITEFGWFVITNQ